jgi:hypothetical protein
MLKRRRFLRDFPAVVGWREWVNLPRLGIDALRAKLDTGASTSSLHAAELSYFDKDGEQWVRVRVHPDPLDRERLVYYEARLLGLRVVRSSSGHEESRPVIRTPVCLGGLCWTIDLTLSSREKMKYAMLLGRQAMAGHIIVDSSRSYVGGFPLHLPAELRKEARKSADVLVRGHGDDQR